MSGSDRAIRVCMNCGGEFLGYAASKWCPDCRAAKGAAKEAAKQEQNSRELSDEKKGWRNMLRDATGTVIVPGGNVMTALDDLCAYEEACEELGVEGPQQLKNLLSHVATLMPKEVIVRCAREGRKPEPRKKREPAQVRIEYGCRCCGSCGHFIQDRETGHGAAGRCAIHPRKIRSGGGKKGILVEVPGEFRKVAGAREACRKWIKRQDTGKNPTTGLEAGPPPLRAGEVKTGRAPEWVGPSAELLPEETGGLIARATGGRPVTAHTEGGAENAG